MKKISEKIRRTTFASSGSKTGEVSRNPSERSDVSQVSVDKVNSARQRIESEKSERVARVDSAKSTRQVATTKNSELGTASANLKELGFPWYAQTMQCKFPKTAAFIQTATFETALGVIIIYNCLQIGIQVHKCPPEDSLRVSSDCPHAFLEVSENICVTIFVAEFFLRGLFHGFMYHLKSYDRVLDTALVWVTGVGFTLIMPFIEKPADQFRTITVLRAFRLLRVARVARHHMKEMWMLLSGLLGSAKALLSMIIVILFVNYLFGIVAVVLIGDAPEFEDHKYQHVQKYFAGLDEAMFTLLQIITADGWASQIARPVMSVMPSMWFFFVTYIAVAVLVLMNIITAIIVENAIAITKDDEEQKLKEMEREKDKDLRYLGFLFEAMDADGSGTLSEEEFDNAISIDPEMVDRFRLLGFDDQEILNLFRDLDPGDGELEFDEFMKGLRSMRGAAQSKDLIRTQRGVERLHRRLDDMCDVMIILLDSMEANGNMGPGNIVSRQSMAIPRNTVARRSKEIIFGAQPSDRSLQSDMTKQRRDSTGSMSSCHWTEPVEGDLKSQLRRKAHKARKSKKHAHHLATAHSSLQNIPRLAHSPSNSALSLQNNPRLAHSSSKRMSVTSSHSTFSVDEESKEQSPEGTTDSPSLLRMPSAAKPTLETFDECDENEEAMTSESSKKERKFVENEATNPTISSAGGLSSSQKVTNALGTDCQGQSPTKKSAKPLSTEAQTFLDRGEGDKHVQGIFSEAGHSSSKKATQPFSTDLQHTFRDMERSFAQACTTKLREVEETLLLLCTDKVREVEASVAQAWCVEVQRQATVPEVEASVAQTTVPEVEATLAQTGCAEVQHKGTLQVPLGHNKSSDGQTDFSHSRHQSRELADDALPTSPKTSPIVNLPLMTPVRLPAAGDLAPLSLSFPDNTPSACSIPISTAFDKIGMDQGAIHTLVQVNNSNIPFSWASDPSDDGSEIPQ